MAWSACSLKWLDVNLKFIHGLYDWITNVRILEDPALQIIHERWTSGLVFSDIYLTVSYKFIEEWSRTKKSEDSVEGNQ